MRQRGFEVVRADKRKTTGDIKLPECATRSSVGYDFFSPIAVTIAPFKTAMIWTDVKAYFLADEALLLNVRSSMGKQPVMMANSQGWVEADYYNNVDNDGNIGFRLLNMGESDYEIKVGDKIGQGMFIKKLTADQKSNDVIRTGGFGSTD